MGILLDRVNAYNKKIEERMRLIELVENLTLDGHSNKEISDILGVPESTVRVLLHE